MRSLSVITDSPTFSRAWERERLSDQSSVEQFCEFWHHDWSGGYQSSVVDGVDVDVDELDAEGEALADRNPVHLDSVQCMVDTDAPLSLPMFSFWCLFVFVVCCVFVFGSGTFQSLSLLVCLCLRKPGRQRWRSRASGCRDCERSGSSPFRSGVGRNASSQPTSRLNAGESVVSGYLNTRIINIIIIVNIIIVIIINIITAKHISVQ